MSKLLPKQVTIGSEAKHFHLDEGVSNGSSMAMTFDIDFEGSELSRHDLNLLILTEKERLDLLVLSAEVLKGSLSPDEYKRRKAMIKKNYDRALHRPQEENGDSK